MRLHVSRPIGLRWNCAKEGLCFVTCFCRNHATTAKQKSSMSNFEFRMTHVNTPVPSEMLSLKWRWLGQHAFSKTSSWIKKIHFTAKGNERHQQGSFVGSTVRLICLDLIVHLRRGGRRAQCSSDAVTRKLGHRTPEPFRKKRKVLTPSIQARRDYTPWDLRLASFAYQVRYKAKMKDPPCASHEEVAVIHLPLRPDSYRDAFCIGRPRQSLAKTFNPTK